MAWNAPRTNWTANDYVKASNIATYIADLNYLYDAIIDAGGSFALGWVNIDRIATDYDDLLYGVDFTRIEWDLWHCAKAVKETLNCPTNYFPTYRGYGDNSKAPDYNRLNLIGTALINIYNYLQTL